MTFLSTARTVHFFLTVVHRWLEKDLFSYGLSSNDLTAVGHYTQLVWAATHKVGCGINVCPINGGQKHYYTYICNYCPM